MFFNQLGINKQRKNSQSISCMRAEINFYIPDGYHSVLHKWEAFVEKSQSLPQIQLYTFPFLKKTHFSRHISLPFPPFRPLSVSVHSSTCTFKCGDGSQLKDSELPLSVTTHEWQRESCMICLSRIRKRLTQISPYSLFILNVPIRIYLPTLQQFAKETLHLAFLAMNPEEQAWMFVLCLPARG